jgi:hypothetical protein
MTKLETDYLDERARQLAYVVLTRRDDLVVAPAEDPGLDYVVHTRKKNRQTERTFGVKVKARQALGRVPRTAVGDWSFPFRYPTLAQDPGTPLCLFVFVMESDTGYYRWLKQPVITEEGKPELHLNLDGGFKKLDNVALEAIIAQVNEWYDAGAVDARVAALLEQTRKDPRTVLLLLASTIEKRVHEQLQEAGLTKAEQDLPLPQAVEAGVRAGRFPRAVLAPVRDFWAMRTRIARQVAVEVPDATILAMAALGTELLKILTPTPPGEGPRRSRPPA